MKKQNVEIPAGPIYEIHLLYKRYTEIPGELSRENIISSQREDNMLFSFAKRSALLWLLNKSRSSQRRL